MSYFCCTFFRKLLLGILRRLKNSVILARYDFFCLIYFHIHQVIFTIINSFSLFLIEMIKLKISLNPILYVLIQILILNLNIFNLILNSYQSNPDIIFLGMKTLSQLSCIYFLNYSYFFTYPIWLFHFILIISFFPHIQIIDLSAINRLCAICLLVHIIKSRILNFLFINHQFFQVMSALR